MRCFESQPLLREIGCAPVKAHNVFHLKGGFRLLLCHFFLLYLRASSMARNITVSLSERISLMDCLTS
jgi:hypothetical protein